MTADEPVRPPTEAERSAEQVFRVRFEEAGADGTIRTSTLLRYAAELAWLHSERRGFGRSWYRERGLAWVVRGVDLRLVGRIEDGSRIVGTTRVTAARKVIARRRTEFWSEDGTSLASIDVDWAMTTAQGAPTRVPAIFGVAFGIDPGPPLIPVRVRLAGPAADPPAPSGSGPVGVRAVRRHELDPMGHVNNAVYLDWAEEAVAAAGGPVDERPRRWRLEFLGAAGPDSSILVRAGSAGTGWACTVDDPVTGERFLGATIVTGQLALDDALDPVGAAAGARA